ncbi:pentatricopeptide repeat-containing protein At2g03880, mitochondrial [Fagus crenata]
MKAISMLKNLVSPLLSLSRPYSLDSIGSRNVPGSSSLLDEFTNFCYQRDLPRAMKAMDAMQRHGIWADSITYSELIKCCLARGAVNDAKLVHNHVFSNGYQPKTFLINVLLNMYVKFNLLDEAQALFDQMPERNVVSWTTMISAYTNAKLNTKALKFLILMLREGVMPNMFTYSSVLRACDGLSNLTQLHCSIIKAGLESDVFSTLTSILRACTGLALLELGRQFNCMISVYCKHGLIDKASRLFMEMEMNDCRPNSITYRYLGLGCLKADLVEEALRTLELGMDLTTTKIVKNSTPWLETTLSIVEIFAENGALVNVEKLFAELIKARYTRYTFVYNTLLKAYVNVKKYDPNFLRRMILGGARPDAETYSMMKLAEQFQS